MSWFLRWFIDVLGQNELKIRFLGLKNIDLDFLAITVVRIWKKQATCRLFFIFKKKRMTCRSPQAEIKKKGLGHMGASEMG